MIRAAILAALVSGCAIPTEAHDWFSGLRAPNGVPCCSDTMRECHPTSMCVAHGGVEGVETKGWGCIPVPLDKVLPMSSPDGEPAVCESPIHGPAPVVYCVMLPVGS